MITYRYKAQSPDGQTVQGVVQGVDEFDAADKIRRTNPIILELKPVKEKAHGDGLLNMEIGGNRINSKNLSVICSQIAITLKSGVPIAKAMELIGAQSEDKVLRKIFLATAEDVQGGAGLASSLERNGKNFPATFIETIRAGEESGNIEHSFSEMAEYYEKTYKNQDKIKSALSYPIFVVCVAIVVLIVVMVMVIPSLTQTFESLGGELPVMTQIMIACSKFFQHAWPFIVIVILAAVIAWKSYTKTEKGKVVQGKAQLRAPVFGKIHQMNGSAEFANTLSMLMSSGITLDHAIEITAKTMNNYVLAREVAAMQPMVESGKSVGDAIDTCQHLPATLKEMTKIGEETGELDQTLKVIGEFYSNEADTAMKNALAKLEPTMLIFLAVFAGFIVISIYLPMFTMYNLM